MNTVVREEQKLVNKNQSTLQTVLKKSTVLFSRMF